MNYILSGIKDVPSFNTHKVASLQQLPMDNLLVEVVRWSVKANFESF